MFEQWPSWIARNRVVRRTAIRVWRVFLRVQRAFLANAVLVVRNSQGRVLLVPAPSGGLQLPTREMNGWLAVGTQVNEWLVQLSPLRAHASLVAVDGTPKSGVIFLYEAVLKTESAGADKIWVEPDSAVSILNGNDRRLLHRCTDRTPRGRSRSSSP
jgi:hypothetical protein